MQSRFAELIDHQENAMLEGILLASTGLPALVTLLPLCRYRVWWIRVWEFPRLQLGALLALLLLAQVLWLDYGQPWHGLMTAVTVACLIYQLAWVVPYTPLAQRGAPGQGRCHRATHSGDVVQCAGAEPAVRSAAGTGSRVSPGHAGDP